MYEPEELVALSKINAVKSADAPLTCNLSVGLVIPIPTRLLVASTDKVPESISKSLPVILPVVTMF